jgi:exopolysaccharide biosynthesis operon protein EpsL
MHKRPWHIKRLLAISIISISAPAYADLSNTFSPYVAAGYGYNSNMFLLQNDQAALTNLGTTSMSESFQSYAAGVNMKWQLGRQLISGRAEVNKTNFNTYKTMDYDGHDLALKWDWLVDGILQGDVGASEKLMLAPFLYTKKPLANLLTTRKVFANGNVKLNNRWQIKLGAEKTQNINSDTTQQNNDIDIDTYKTGFRYTTPKGSKLDFNSSVSNGNHTNQPTPQNSYTQYDNGIGFDWVATGKTKVTGEINYTQRDYPNTQQQNYSGITGRVAADWLVTGKTTLNFALYREINTYITNTSSYSVTQGISAQAAWLATAKITVNLTAKHDQIDFLNTPHRLDELTTAGLGMTYSVLRNTKLDILTERGIRDSSIDGNSYRYNSLMLGLNHAF